MTLPKVNINIQTGNIGRVDDLGNGIPGLLVQTATSPTGHAYGDVIAYSSYDDLPAELQAIDGLELYFKVAPGYKVYIMPVADTTDIDDLVNHLHATPYAKTLVEAGNGEIRFIGVIGELLLADLATAITNAQALAAYFAALQNPVAVFLPYSWVTADVVIDLKTRTDNRVGVVVSYAGDEIGLLLGKLASTPVQRHPGRVKDGALPLDEAILEGHANPQVLIEENMTQVGTFHDSGYIVLGVHIGKSGYYFMGMPMATAATDDYATIVNRRTIDKAHVISYGVYVEELNEEVYVDDDGKLQPGYVKQMQGAIEDALDLQMRGELSGRSAFFDDQQNVVQTSNITGVVKLQPVGHSSTITINLGLTNTL